MGSGGARVLCWDIRLLDVRYKGRVIDDELIRRRTLLITGKRRIARFRSSGLGMSIREA